MIFRHKRKAEQALRALVDAGIRPDRISFFVRATFDQGKLQAELDEAVEHGGTLGAELGAIAGLVLFVIPGVGPVLGTGSLATAVTGAILGSSFGGIAGALAGAGLSETEAALAEHHIRDGKAVLVVRDDHDYRRLSAIAREQGSIAVAHA